MGMRRIQMEVVIVATNQLCSLLAAAAHSFPLLIMRKAPPILKNLQAYQHSNLLQSQLQRVQVLQVQVLQAQVLQA